MIFIKPTADAAAVLNGRFVPTYLHLTPHKLIIICHFERMLFKPGCKCSPVILVCVPPFCKCCFIALHQYPVIVGIQVARLFYGMLVGKQYIGVGLVVFLFIVLVYKVLSHPAKGFHIDLFGRQY